MEPQDELREVKVHAISLRRPRGKKRTAHPLPQRASLTSRMLGSLQGGVAWALEPPQQSWLALLGFSSLAIKSSGHAWRRLVSEGADVQAQVSSRMAKAWKRVAGPLGKPHKLARDHGPAEA